MSQDERRSKKDPLAELARLIERDEAFRGLSREGQEARAPGVQAGASDVAIPAHVAANYHEYEARYDEGHDGVGAKRENRGRAGAVVAVIVLIVLVATAGTFGYFAWWSGPHDNGPDSMVAADPSANRAPERDVTKSAGRPSARNPSTDEPTLAGAGAPAELNPAPPRQTFPAPRGVTDGSDPTVSAVPATSSDAANGPSQPLEPQSAAEPGDVSAAERRAAPPAGDPAPLIVGARSPPADPSVEPPPVAANAVPGQSYIVQLSSQRSDKAAQITAEFLQRKYQSVFGGRRPFIRRSDLGGKGVYFRVLLGTFANFQDANQLCSDLKKVGGDCVVQKN